MWESLRQPAGVAQERLATAGRLLAGVVFDEAGLQLVADVAARLQPQDDLDVVWLADRAALAVPIELLRLTTAGGGELGPLALIGGVSVRRQPRGVKPAPTAVAAPGPLRVLAAVAASEETRTTNVPLDVEAEMQALLGAVSDVAAGPERRPGGQVRLTEWFDALRYGRTSPPRCPPPRKDGTVRIHITAALAALNIWTAAGHQSLRKISRQDVLDVLPANRHRRHQTFSTLRSLFRFLKVRRLVFTNPAGAARASQQLNHPLPVDLDPSAKPSTATSPHAPLWPPSSPSTPCDPTSSARTSPPTSGTVACICPTRSSPSPNGLTVLGAVRYTHTTDQPADGRVSSEPRSPDTLIGSYLLPVPAGLHVGVREPTDLAQFAHTCRRG